MKRSTGSQFGCLLLASALSVAAFANPTNSGATSTTVKPAAPSAPPAGSKDRVPPPPPAPAQPQK
ncbi:hypothetical protein [Parvibium lacunae]|uniref:hypothetical protein n=1 Tax=Parvibium lacunae TaxID=1888893 RepID=UPI0011C04AAC|nr:hypothetical protein [Parvibium lacunae]